MVIKKIYYVGLDVLRDWYGKLYAAVRWCGALSYVFCIGSGVRQGGGCALPCFI